MTPKSVRLHLLATALALALSACGSNPPAPVQATSLPPVDMQALTAEADFLAGQFGKTLLTTVQAAVAHGGLHNGISVCQQVAPTLAQAASANGWQVGRTTLRLRSPANAPDAWEREVLQQFEQARRAQPQQLPAPVSAVVAGEFRYMKPIVVAQPCLACHGSALAPATAATLKALYPADQATGYQTSELRGAFTLRKTVSLSPAIRSSAP